MLKMTVYNIVRFLSYIMLGIIFIIGVNIYLVYHTGTPAYITKDIEMYTTSEMDVVKCNLKAGDTIFVLYDDFDAKLAKIRYVQDNGTDHQETLIGFIDDTVYSEVFISEKFSNIEAPLIIKVLPNATFEEFVSEYNSLSKFKNIVGVYITDYQQNNDTFSETISQISNFCESMTIPYGLVNEYTDERYNTYLDNSSYQTREEDYFDYQILPRAFDVTRQPFQSIENLEECILYTDNPDIDYSWFIQHTSGSKFPDFNSLDWSNHSIIEFYSSLKFSYSYVSEEFLEKIVSNRNERYSE